MSRHSRGTALADPVDAAPIHRQPYHDTIALLGGRAPDTDSGTLGPAESRALVGHLLDCWRVLPSVPVTLVDDELRRLLRDDDYVVLRNCWLAVSAFAKAQAVAVRQLAVAFERSGRNYALLKGAAAGLRLYGRLDERTYTDADIGVARRDLGAAAAIAHDLGYRPAQKSSTTDRFEPADRRLRAQVEAQHYELGFLVRRLKVTDMPAATLAAIDAEPWAQQLWIRSDDGKPWCYALVDIHHALSLDIELDHLLSRTRQRSLHGLTARLPDDAWLAAHLIFKIYWEGLHNYGKGLYQYADLVRVVPLLEPAVFADLVSILSDHSMVAAGHYVLRRLPLFGVQLPAHIDEFVTATCVPPGVSQDPVRGPFSRHSRGGSAARHNDLGDMWPHLWGHR